MERINSLRDPKTGRFQTTTDVTRYKIVQFNNKRMSAHAREICIALNIPEVPKGFVVHHIDENKRNNNIDNLALMTITAHNRIHSHKPWNKGMKFGDNDKFDNAIFMARKKREEGFYKKFEETYNLKTRENLSSKDLAERLKLSEATINLRIKRYLELKEKYEQN